MSGMQARWAGPILKIRCQGCSLQYPAGDLNFLPGGAVRCYKCMGKGLAEMTKFSAGHSRSCSECGHKFTPGDIRVNVVWKDGVWQALCDGCNAVYIPKRRDLFKGTQFAKEMNL